MTADVRPCQAEDLRRLLGSDPPPHLVHHHRERYDLQRAGAGLYLLAWDGGRNVGRATLYTESKYPEVRRRHPGTAEVNALEASPQGRGTGTALLLAAERYAVEGGHPAIGLAVEPANAAARRLYERLGYRLWGAGTVVDRWTEITADGPGVEHADPCDYLITALPAPP